MMRRGEKDSGCRSCTRVNSWPSCIYGCNVTMAGGGVNSAPAAAGACCGKSKITSCELMQAGACCIGKTAGTLDNIVTVIS